MSQICTGNPDQIWCYDEPPEEDGKDRHMEYSEKEILAYYSPWWNVKMKELGRENLISDVNCIDDWIILNFAYKKPDTVSK